MRSDPLGGLNSMATNKDKVGPLAVSFTETLKRIGKGEGDAVEIYLQERLG